jgi:hypothetical protein
MSIGKNKAPPAAGMRRSTHDLRSASTFAFATLAELGSHKDAPLRFWFTDEMPELEGADEESH